MLLFLEPGNPMVTALVRVLTLSLTIVPTRVITAALIPSLTHSISCTVAQSIGHRFETTQVVHVHCFMGVKTLTVLFACLQPNFKLHF